MTIAITADNLMERLEELQAEEAKLSRVLEAGVEAYEFSVMTLHLEPVSISGARLAPILQQMLDEVRAELADVERKVDAVNELLKGV